ncbi:MAG: hypothetical protein AABX76_02765 [Nanoarchaeota archaeon]
MTDDLETKVDGIITEFNELPETSSWEKTKKIAHFIYVLEIGGALMRRYQKRLAEGIGWKEKDLTIGHAVICTIIPALSQTAFAYFFEDKFGETATNAFMGYQGFYLAQGVFRMSYAQKTKKAIGAVGLIAVAANAAYVTKEVVLSGKKRLERILEDF